MLRSFWFYFNSIPVAFSLLFFSINLLFVWGSDYTTPSFNNAVIQCKDVSNDRWVEDDRTYQDKCVDEFMGEESFMTTASELFLGTGFINQHSQNSFYCSLIYLFITQLEKT